MPNLYLVHCGFYDQDFGGIYESHVNLFVAAESFEEARVQAKQLDVFRSKRMHIDGIQLISAVQGWTVNLEREPLMGQKSIVINKTFRELAPAE